jgi:hypothetical protein
MNIILVMSDSFRRDHIGAFGNQWIKTPALDRFAGQSVVFPHFRMGSYATIPQRTDMQSSRRIGHDLLLLAIEPPSQRNYDELPRVRDHRRHSTDSAARQAGQSASFEAPPN